MTRHTPEINKLISLNFIVALIYAVLGIGAKIAISLDSVDVPFWPAAGFASALCFLRGPAILPGVLLGSTISAYCTQDGCSDGLKLYSFFIGLAAAAQAGAASWILHRLGFYNKPPNRGKRLILFLLIVGPAGCWLSAATFWIISTLGFGPESSTIYSTISWWIGDSIGSLVFFPLVVVNYPMPPDNTWKKLRPILRNQLIGLLLLPLITTALAANLTADFSQAIGNYPDKTLERLNLLLIANELLFVMMGLGFTLATSNFSLEQLCLNERSKIAAEAAKAVVHEISQPLFRLRFRLDKLQQNAAEMSSYGQSDESINLMKDEISNSLAEAHRLGVITKSIQDLTMSGVRDSQVAEVRQAIEDAISQIQPLIRMYNTSLGTHNIEDSALVGTGQIQLQIALRNLLANAARAASHEGILRITTEIDEMDICIIIEDSGPGLPAEICESSKPSIVPSSEGMGIGLMIARLAIENVGGRLILGRSIQLGGASIKVLLPLRT
jgi:signal transduction histidine kinase